MRNTLATCDALLAKAQRACASAHTLLRDHDPDGASGRAYYAMFNAARAVLLAACAPHAPAIPHKHAGIISAFGLFLTRNHPELKELGHTLNRAQQIRRVADYNGDLVDERTAQEMAEQAAAFIAAVQDTILPQMKRITGA